MKLIPNSVSRVAIAAGAVLVLGGSAAGIAAAQATPTPTPTAQQQGYQKFIDALAQRLGVSSQQLQSDITQARQDAGLPANGGFGGGRGPGGPRPGFRPFVDLQAAAQVVGITPQQLRTELQGKSLAEVATSHGKQPNDLVTALTNAANTRIDQAVASGRLTADQGNTQKSNAAARINQLVNQVMPQGGPGGTGRAGPGGPRGFGFGMVQQGLSVAAQAIGITPQQLQTELAGKSLAQVAASHGKQRSDVVTALTNTANSQIDQAVSSGQLTADQGNTRKTNIDNRIQQLVDQTWPQGGPGGPRRGPGTPQPQAQGQAGA
jgi:hypothetical protein